MIMTTLLNLFYRLPPIFIAQVFLLFTCLYICAQQWFAQHRWFRRGRWVSLMLWIIAALWITTFSRTPGTVHPPELIPFHSYRKLFSTGVQEILRANFMNVVLFYPAGLLTASLLPDIQPRWRTMLFTCTVFGLFSLGIEWVQYLYALGEPEIDDVIHNTLGTVFGTIPILLWNLLRNPAK